MNQTYPSLDAFYADELRLRSPEVDFGVMWTDGPRWPQYRVSWIEKTGEVYAVRLDGSGGRVELLGQIKDRDAVDRVLEGWEYADTLAWARTRLRAFRPDPSPGCIQSVVDKLEIDSDEDGFHLRVSDNDGQEYDFRIHGVAFDFAGSEGLRSLLEWRGEGESVRAELRAMRGDVPADEGYAPDDPKHPSYHERMSLAGDLARKADRERS